ncbi:DUF4351 domain-containing protein [Paraliomyxa miuraensis]|uniref:DUF4351 domain-containing protein n=1 Tax=Paraliomyxa miuraensis TaxID=376150 RepID=UPI002254F8CA|nr:DUF4351 domain-containing protein [Paraliomyxa miuraensis]MCX4245889.1 DUF4351 domain-containing protein [Paraliomyxa miuraensis]
MDRLHTVLEVEERHGRTALWDELSIHLLQLGAPPRPALLEGQGSDYDGVVERWARFFTCFDDEVELQRLAAEDPMMALAKQTLEEISQDPETRRRAREREDEIKLDELERRASRKAAMAEGKVELILKLLTKRFGSVPLAARARVEAAASEQLDAWAERVLTASTLDDVLAS